MQITPGTYRLKILSIHPVCEDGKICSRLYLAYDNKTINVDLPYHADIEPKTFGLELELNVDQYGRVVLTNKMPDSYNYRFNYPNRCPFCNTPLVNISTDINSDVYCSNPSCSGLGLPEHRIINLICNRLSTNDLTYNEVLSAVGLARGYREEDINILTIYEVLHNIYVTSNELSPEYQIIYEKMKRLLSKRSVVDMLRIINVPIILDPEISYLDNCFNNPVDFINAMGNYLVLQKSVNLSQETFALINIFLHTNNNYIHRYMYILNTMC